MSTFTIVVLCLQACLVQNAFGYLLETQCGAGLNNPAWGHAGSAGIGLGSGLGGAQFAHSYGSYGAGSYGAGSLAAAQFAPALGASFAPVAGTYETGFGAYGGEGVGDVAVAGEMPVAGTTLVAGQVPILGAVRFAGDLPAGGVVSISGSCGCGRSSYMY